MSFDPFTAPIFVAGSYRTAAGAKTEDVINPADLSLVGKIALWKSLLTAFVFTAVMFVTFDVAFDVIMPKGPIEALFGK